MNIFRISGKTGDNINATIQQSVAEENYLITNSHYNSTYWQAAEIQKN